MKLKIRKVPNLILRQKSKPIKKITPVTRDLAKKMIKIIKKGGENERIGVGLSAVQVGQLKKLFVVYFPKKNQDKVFVNPQIIWHSKKMTKGVPERDFPYEGCLSVPGYLGLVKRHWAIKLAWQDLSGKRHQKKFTGFVATVIQHEFDHTNGILFIDQVLKQKSQLFKVKKENGENKLVEVAWL